MKRTGSFGTRALENSGTRLGGRISGRAYIRISRFFDDFLSHRRKSRNPNPPRNGEVAARSADGGGGGAGGGGGGGVSGGRMSKTRPLHHPVAPDSPPPRSGEDLGRVKHRT